MIIGLLTIIIFVYSYEAYLTLKISNTLLDKKKIYKEKYKKKFDTRSKRMVYQDIKSKNKSASMTKRPFSYIYKDNLDLMLLSGKSNSLEIDCNENGYYSKYKSDRFGFNNPDTEWDSPEVEFLLVGDSFVQGACVNRPNDISSRLRFYSKKSALNLGMSGNGPLLEYASLKEYYKTNTKKVLWFFYEANDLINLSDEINNKILMNYLDNENFSQNLKLKQKNVDAIHVNSSNKIVIPNFYLSNNFKFLKLSNLRYKIKILIINSKNQKNKKNVINNEILNIFKKILYKTKSLTDQNNSELYLVYLPRYERYLTKNYNLKEYELIKKILIEMNISIIDIHKDVFDKEDDPLNLFPFKKKGHYTIEGYDKIAKNILKKIN